MSAKSTSNFEYHAPASVGEVVELLDKYGENAKLISGGTDFIPKMKALVLTPDHVISLKNVKGLSYIDFDCSKGLRIGARTTLRNLENHPVVRAVYPVLYQGIHSMASTQVRNRGTMVGNICNAVPSADTAPALLVLNAIVKIVGPKEERTVPIEKFFTGVCKTVVAPNELVTEVALPAVPEGAVMNYFKSSTRRALDLAIVGVAANIIAEDGICKDARIALGAVAVTPKRANKTEEMLIGKELTEELIDRAALFAANEECNPISDVRASEEYRRELVRLSVRDAVKAALK